MAGKTLTVGEILQQAVEVSGMSLAEMAEFAAKAEAASLRAAMTAAFETRPDGALVFRMPQRMRSNG
jgi:hypothetical protein